MGKNKNKRRRYKQKKYSISRIIGYIFVALLALAFIIKVGYGIYINHVLKEQGYCTDAIVYNRHKTGKGMSVTSHYQFTWKGIIYYGKSYHDTKTQRESLFYDNFITGDTITIVFLENDPNINMSNSEVKKDCECITYSKRQP